MSNKSRQKSIVLRLAAAAAALLAAAFSPGYVLRQARGQLRVLRGRQPLESVLPTLPPGPQAKVRLVLDAKRFGEERVGLKRSPSFTTYYDTGGRPISYNVSACPKDELAPVTWWFPVAGRIPYLGFFQREQAEAEKKKLEARGYDVVLSSVQAYSTLGWFKDPLYSGLLKLSDFRLAELVLHELTHGTVYSKKDGDFNEALASFVGGEAALLFLAETDGPDSPEVRDGRARRERDRRDEDTLRRLHARLKELYGSPLSREAKLAAREKVFHDAREADRALIPEGFNNASLLAELRYSGLDVFEKAFEEEHRDFRAFLERARRAARSKEPFKAMAESR